MNIIVISLTLSQGQFVIAQQQQQQQQLSGLETYQSLSHAKQEQSFLKDISFDIDGVTFSHHTASVNGIQMHYVIGGKGDPLCYCMDFHNPGMNGDISCQLWLKIILLWHQICEDLVILQNL